MAIIIEAVVLGAHSGSVKMVCPGIPIWSGFWKCSRIVRIWLLNLSTSDIFLFILLVSFAFDTCLRVEHITSFDIEAKLQSLNFKGDFVTSSNSSLFHKSELAVTDFDSPLKI